MVFRFAVSALVLVPGFKPRTILQLITGMLFVFVYFVLVMRADPMLQRENNAFNSFVILQLLFTIWAGLFIRLQDGTTASSFAFGYDELFVTIALFATNISVIVVGLFYLAKDLASDHRRLVYKYVSDNTEVCLPPLKTGDLFHMFLSHQQMYGQDQVEVMKYRLEALVPGIRVFIDTDLSNTGRGLQNVSELKGFVESSEMAC